MTRPAAPDPARARLRGLSSPVRGAPGPAVETVRPPAGPEPGERRGWPTAAPGTPAARLRLPAVPEHPTWSWPAPPEPDRDADDDPDPPGGHTGARGTWGEQARGAAWDAAAHRGGRWAQRWLPASWHGARWDPGRAGALALAVVTALAALAAAVGVWRDRPVTEPVPALPAIASAPLGAAGAAALPAVPAVPAADGRAATPRGGPVVVSVTGRVGRPGLVRLPEGSRVGEAITAAGGAARGVDLTGLNLAQRLADGEQVVVGVRVPGTTGPSGGGVMGAGAPGGGAAVGGGGGGGAAGRGGAAGPGDKVDLNRATLEQLDQLPGVGPVTAQKILDWRTENGRFAAIEQLQEVGGIGEARFAQLRARVRV